MGGGLGCRMAGEAPKHQHRKGLSQSLVWGRWQFWLLDSPSDFSPEVTAGTRELSCLREVPLTRMPMGIRSAGRNLGHVGLLSWPKCSQCPVCIINCGPLVIRSASALILWWDLCKGTFNEFLSLYLMHFPKGN